MRMKGAERLGGGAGGAPRCNDREGSGKRRVVQVLGSGVSGIRRTGLRKGGGTFGHPELTGKEREKQRSFQIFTSERGRRFTSKWLRKLCWEFQTAVPLPSHIRLYNVDSDCVSMVPIKGSWPGIVIRLSRQWGQPGQDNGGDSQESREFQCWGRAGGGAAPRTVVFKGHQLFWISRRKAPVEAPVGWSLFL